MTPENVLKASELIDKLKQLRDQAASVQIATDADIALSASPDLAADGFEHVWRSMPAISECSGRYGGHFRHGSELFEEIKSLLFNQITSNIDCTERELRALGVQLPAPDFVNLPQEGEAHPADPSAAH